MMRFRLRTLLILMAIMPPFIAWWGWPTMRRILWPPKPAMQINVMWNGLIYDFAFPIQPSPPPTAAVCADGDPPAVQASTDNDP